MTYAMSAVMAALIAALQLRSSAPIVARCFCAVNVSKAQCAQ